MEELKKKIVQLRKKLFSKELTKDYCEKAEYTLKQEVFDLMREEPNKQELYEFWTAQFTGNYNG